MHLMPSSESISNNLARFLPQLLVENIPRGAQIYKLSVRRKAQSALLWHHTIGHKCSTSPQEEKLKHIHCPTGISKFCLSDQNKAEV